MMLAKEILGTLPRKDDYEFFLSMGVEYECFVFDKNGLGVDLEKYPELLNEGGFLPGVRGFDLEVGKNMLEIVFEPVFNLKDYFDVLKRVFLFLSLREESKEWRFLFSDNPIFPGYTKIPLYLALHKINGFEIATRQLSKYASFQSSFGMQKFGGVFSDEAKKILYVLNNLSTALSIYFEDMFCIKSSRLPNIFTNFNSGKERLPHPLDLEYVSDLKKNLLKIPNIVVCDSNNPNNFINVLDRLPEKIDDNHCRMIWWFARINGVEKNIEERIEPRFLNIIQPAHSGEVMKMMDKMVRYIIKTKLSDIPKISNKDWWNFRSNFPNRILAKIIIAEIFKKV